MVKCRAVVQGKIPPQNFLRAKIVAQKLQRKEHTIKIRQFIHHMTEGYTQKLQHRIKTLG